VRFACALGARGGLQAQRGELLQQRVHAEPRAVLAQQ